MASLTDISLVAQVAVLGNRRAFDELVRRYQSPVRRFFLHQTLGDEQLSDDLAQDTFIKAYTNISKFRGLASFQTWLMRIAYNVFYDHTRSKSPKLGDDRGLNKAPSDPQPPNLGGLYRLGGNSCLSGDFMEYWQFDHELQVGEEVIFEDMIHYTTVKTNMFNGVRHPSIGMLHEDGKLEILREFDYTDYKNRMD